ncbi:MoaD/ThiS family protein [Clostridiaceae bacterium 35-E11]
MGIEVRLFATLRQGRGKKVFFDYKENLTPLEIIHRLNISKEDVAILLINGRDGQIEEQLRDEDYLSIFPPVGGG